MRDIIHVPGGYLVEVDWLFAAVALLDEHPTGGLALLNHLEDELLVVW